MGAIASQITSLTIVYSTVYSDADQRKHQISASLAFVQWFHRGPVNSPYKWPVTRKMSPFDDVIMIFVLDDRRHLLLHCYTITLQIGVIRKMVDHIFVLFMIVIVTITTTSLANNIFVILDNVYFVLSKKTLLFLKRGVYTSLNIIGLIKYSRLLLIVSLHKLLCLLMCHSFKMKHRVCNWKYTVYHIWVCLHQQNMSIVGLVVWFRPGDTLFL